MLYFYTFYKNVFVWFVVVVSFTLIWIQFRLNCGRFIDWKVNNLILSNFQTSSIDVQWITCSHEKSCHRINNQIKNIVPMAMNVNSIATITVQYVASIEYWITCWNIICMHTIMWSWRSSRSIGRYCLFNTIGNRSIELGKFLENSFVCLFDSLFVILLLLNE